MASGKPKLVQASKPEMVEVLRHLGYTVKGKSILKDGTATRCNWCHDEVSTESLSSLVPYESRHGGGIAILCGLICMMAADDCIEDNEGHELDFTPATRLRNTKRRLGCIGYRAAGGMSPYPPAPNLLGTVSPSSFAEYTGATLTTGLDRALGLNLDADLMAYKVNVFRLPHGQLRLRAQLELPSTPHSDDRKALRLLLPKIRIAILAHERALLADGSRLEDLREPWIDQYAFLAQAGKR